MIEVKHERFYSDFTSCLLVYLNGFRMKKKQNNFALQIYFKILVLCKQIYVSFIEELNT